MTIVSKECLYCSQERKSPRCLASHAVLCMSHVTAAAM